MACKTRASFASSEPNRKPSYYLQISVGAAWWRTKSCWYRIFADGSCGEAIGVTNPDNTPSAFTPQYGDLVITIDTGVN
jgi:hypothetical protein